MRSGHSIITAHQLHQFEGMRQVRQSARTLFSGQLFSLQWSRAPAVGAPVARAAHDRRRRRHVHGQSTGRPPSGGTPPPKLKPNFMKLEGSACAPPHPPPARPRSIGLRV